MAARCPTDKQRRRILAIPSPAVYFVLNASAKIYIDEVKAFLDEHDGWNADGKMGGREYNTIPFSDLSYTDSSGNSWEGYTPKNTPYKVSSSGRFTLVNVLQ